jgi:hypothetical protein
MMSARRLSILLLRLAHELLLGFGRLVVSAMLLVGALAILLGAYAPQAAQAQELSAAPWWGITSGARPSALPAKGVGQIVIVAENLGNAATQGKVTIEDQLPEGFTVANGEVIGIAGGAAAFDRGPVKCTAAPISCSIEKYVNENSETVNQSIPPYETIEIRIAVKLGAKAQSGALNTATVSGGGASGVRTQSNPIQVSPAGAPQSFGIEDYGLFPEEQGGLSDTQAGSHPFQLTSTITFNSQSPEAAEVEGEPEVKRKPRAAALPKDVVAELPPGMIGNPTPFTQCTDAQFGQNVHAPSNSNGEPQPINACPASSAIGVVTVTFNEPNTVHFTTAVAPIFNMVPRQGEPARFGFKAAGIVSAFLDTSLRSGGDYGVDVSSLNIPQIQWLLGVKLTFWGTPGAASHNAQRGWNCLEELGGPGACSATSESSPPPFLVMPSSCTAPFSSSIHGDTWPAAGKPEESAEHSFTLAEKLDGCNRLPFTPSIQATPDGSAASSPTGLDVDVHVPQQSVLNAESLSESAVKDITVALPEGVAVNPSGSDGLQACSEGLVGFTGFQPFPEGSQTATFTPKLPEPFEAGVNFCPDASKVGTVEIATPLLPPGQHLKGSVYLATQDQNPFGSLIALYIIAEDPISGALVKLPGEVHLTESGQLISTFQNSPQLAFEDAELHFFGGERAPLGTPAHCGPYTTNASFTPWSGGAAVSSQSTFSITSGPNGSPCPGASLPFSPTLTAGTTNIQAGAFSGLSTTIGREDGNQDLSSVTLQMPPGLSGILSGVPLCPEAEANAGTCPEASRIGETTVSAGLGSDPVSVTGGRVYITETYKGAPFGLSIVNPVKAGPFDLENTSTNHPPCDCVVVRAKIEIDPLTAQLRVSTDKEGPYSIPHLIQGIPVQIKHVNVLINRPGFTFNPTNCAALQINGQISSDGGASSPVSVPFQAANCSQLAFKPGFAASTAGKTSKANGASLQVKLTYPKGALGTQANIAMVKVDLPKQLPSRLTTLQKACLAATFEVAPIGSGCPAASIVGHAKVITQLLPVPLEGNAYFVSHGNEAFPSLEMVLKGYGVTVELIGETFIRNGITSSTFKATPDVPFESFELTLPQGPFSALAANGNLCKPTTTTTTKKRVAVKRKGRIVKVTKTTTKTVATQLLMPTAFVAQNGAQIHQSTKISVSGCPKATAVKAKKAPKKKAAKKKK